MGDTDDWEAEARKDAADWIARNRAANGGDLPMATIRSGVPPLNKGDLVVIKLADGQVRRGIVMDARDGREPYETDVELLMDWIDEQP